MLAITSTTMTRKTCNEARLTVVFHPLSGEAAFPRRSDRRLGPGDGGLRPVWESLACEAREKQSDGDEKDLDRCPAHVGHTSFLETEVLQRLHRALIQPDC